MNDTARPKIGIALGGGGAKGLAHIPMLQALDRHSIKPCQIAGTSIGAIMGTLYAAGIPADRIHEGISELVAPPKSLTEVFETKRLFAWLEYFDIDISRGSLLHVDKFLDELEEVIGVSTFEELTTPLKIVAADFWKREEVVFDSGPIIPALSASFALPGIFRPLVQDGRVLVDGGSVNPLPYDLLDCDYIIAIDVLGQRSPSEDLLPSYSETLFNTFQIAEKAILTEKMKRRPPDVYIEVQVRDVRMLDFHKSEAIFEQAKPAVRELEEALASLEAG